MTLTRDGSNTGRNKMTIIEPNISREGMVRQPVRLAHQDELGMIHQNFIVVDSMIIIKFKHLSNISKTKLIPIC